MVVAVVGTLGKMLTLVYFIPIVIIGIAGNMWVIFSVVRILYKTWSPVNNVFKHMSLYILILSIADMFVLCMVPLLITYFIGGSWQFGFIGCKLFFAVENVNKLLSVAILAVMSFERFLAISRPFNWCCCRIRRKRVSNVLVVVFLLLFSIILLCLPIIHYAETTPTTYFDYETHEPVSVILCGAALPDEVMSTFITYMFFLGFMSPVFFITICYYFLIRHLKKNDGRNMFVTSYTTKVVHSVLRVVIFHFVCWTPFWMFVFVPLLSYFGVMDFPFQDTKEWQTMRMISSFLPYLNSAGNWIFYAAMNRELRETVTVIGRKSKMLSKLPACKRSSSELKRVIMRNFMLRNPSSGKDSGNSFTDDNNNQLPEFVLIKDIIDNQISSV
ncbi:7 transmembrane receptor (rhodopsin family) domain-containing protein [Ditylenchus destructor]|nr:7 transmembrane receptor (rhodopsin family) domain-containing protein [Ditylenchus destructor]